MLEINLRPQSKVHGLNFKANRSALASKGKVFVSQQTVRAGELQCSTNCTLAAAIAQHQHLSPHSSERSRHRNRQTAQNCTSKNLHFTVHEFPDHISAHNVNKKLRLQMLLDYVERTQSRSNKLLEPTKL